MLNRFEAAKERVQSSKHYKDTISARSPYGYFNGRPIIGESTPIDGGIYIGVFAQEAIVIDRKYKDIEPLVERTIDEAKKIKKEAELLQLVVAIAKQALPRDDVKLDQMPFHKKAQDDGKILLDVYVNNNIGTWRHQVLLTAYLIERLHEVKLLAGFPSFDTKLDPAIGDRERLIYVSERGNLYTLFEPPNTGFN